MIYITNHVDFVLKSLFQFISKVFNSSGCVRVDFGYLDSNQCVRQYSFVYRTKGSFAEK
ncbi:hypothetical protein LguiA_007317 [Lonicera macranthoides]